MLMEGNIGNVGLVLEKPVVLPAFLSADVEQPSQS